MNCNINEINKMKCSQIIISKFTWIQITEDISVEIPSVEAISSIKLLRVVNPVNSSKWLDEIVKSEEENCISFHGKRTREMYLPLIFNSALNGYLQLIWDGEW